MRKTNPNSKGSKGKVKQVHREAIIESVNRLSQPRSSHKTKDSPSKKANSSEYLDYDETPVGGQKSPSSVTPRPKKEPLKYGITNTHRMRVLASRPDHVKQVDAKHEQLVRQVKSNLDNLSLSSAAVTSTTLNDETMHKNLEKVLFDTAESTWNNSGITTQKSHMHTSTLKNTGVGVGVGSLTRSPMNLSLLNKVEMESTYDTMHNLTNVNNNTHNIVLLGQHLYEDEFSSESSSNQYQQQQQAKMVQFGNTTHHRYSASSGGHPSSQATTTHSTTSSKASSPATGENAELNDMLNDTKFNEYEESTYSTNNHQVKNRNIFLENQPKNSLYDDDFHSSLDSSLTSSKQSVTTTTSNFFTAAVGDRKNQESPSPRSPRSPRRVYGNNLMTKDDRISENDDEYDEIEYLGQTNPSIKTSSKYSNSNDYQSYNMKSFIDDSLSLSKDTNDSYK